MSERKWLRDWDNFNFNEFGEKLEKELDGGNPESIMSREEMMDMLEYLKVHNPELMMQTYFYDLFIKKGCSVEEATFLAEHIDLVKLILDNWEEE